MHPIVQKWLPRIIGTQINVMSWVAPKKAGRKAFDLFCTPRKGKLRPRDEQYLATAEDNLQIDTPHGKIQTYSWNNTGEQTVLLMHGWESNSARWRFLITQLLEQNYRVVAMDAPAHGQSEGTLFHMPKYAETIHDVMQHYQVDHMVGHSVGGMATMYYLSNNDYPDISSVIIMGAPGEFEPILKQFFTFLRLSGRSRKVIYRFFERKFGHHPSYFSIDTYGKDLSIPVLVIHDKHDKVIPFKASSSYMKKLEDVQLMRTQKLGHSLQDQAVFEKILHFFEEKETVKN